MKGILLDFSRKPGDPPKLCMCPGASCFGHYPYGSVCKRLNEALRESTGKPIVPDPPTGDGA